MKERKERQIGVEEEALKGRMESPRLATKDLCLTCRKRGRKNLLLSLLVKEMT